MEKNFEKDHTKKWFFHAESDSVILSSHAEEENSHEYGNLVELRDAKDNETQADADNVFVEFQK